MNTANAYPSGFPGIYVEVTLGSPRARCARFGVCEARILTPREWAEFIPGASRVVKARVFGYDELAICFAFRRQEMLDVTWDYFFASGLFRVDKPKALPKSIGKIFGWTDPVVLPGYYPCLEQANGETWLLLIRNPAIFGPENRRKIEICMPLPGQ